MCQTELDSMENCEEYQYKNSLNIFSLTLGPFEKEAEKKRAIAVGGDENIDALDQNNENDELFRMCFSV